MVESTTKDTRQIEVKEIFIIIFESIISINSNNFY